MGITGLLCCLCDVTVGVSLQTHYPTDIHQLQSCFYGTQEEICFKEQGKRDISKTILILFCSAISAALKATSDTYSAVHSLVYSWTRTTSCVLLIFYDKVKQFKNIRPPICSELLFTIFKIDVFPFSVFIWEKCRPQLGYETGGQEFFYF